MPGSAAGAEQCSPAALFLMNLQWLPYHAGHPLNSGASAMPPPPSLALPHLPQSLRCKRRPLCIPSFVQISARVTPTCRWGQTISNSACPLGLSPALGRTPTSAMSVGPFCPSHLPWPALPDVPRYLCISQAVQTLVFVKRCLQARA